jgi:hypothetical protein
MQGEASTRLGFTDYFRVELAWAKLLGAVLLLAPVPARLKEWAYAAFAITLGSALIAHLSIGEGPRRRGAGRRAPGVLWGLSYFVASPRGRGRCRCPYRFPQLAAKRVRAGFASHPRCLEAITVGCSWFVVSHGCHREASAANNKVTWWLPLPVR